MMRPEYTKVCINCSHFEDFGTTTLSTKGFYCGLHKEHARITHPREQYCGDMGYLDIKYKIRNNKIDEILG